MKLTFKLTEVLISIAVLLAVAATVYSVQNNYLLAYGDAESHLNIAKRVTHSLTPGLAQLGGIWLPLPHLLMVPFTIFNTLWWSGVAGSIVSGLAYVVAGIYIFKLTRLITGDTPASVLAFFTFAFNPNVLYMQTTAMTELPLIALFILSVYHFTVFLKDDSKLLALVYAALFALAASLTRYDGWFLVLVEAGVLVLFYGNKLVHYWRKVGLVDTKSASEKFRSFRSEVVNVLEGKLILFLTLAGVGIIGWIIWDYAILGDPLYFTNSPFSAKSQQMGWLARGELPSYQNLYQSFLYYTVTSWVNIGKILSFVAFGGISLYLLSPRQKERVYVAMLLLFPFLFYVVTLYMGQSVIFIPELTPTTFEWTLFNVRYGLMMMPAAAFAIGYLASLTTRLVRSLVHRPLMKVVFQGFAQGLLVGLIALQVYRFSSGKEEVVTLKDGVEGLSAADDVDAQYWMAENYDGGLVLIDDYARTMSVIRSRLPMEKVIYIGNKPYWDESFKEPEKHATWIVMQKDDSVWKGIYENPEVEPRLFTYFQKVYTSPEILIFKRTEPLATTSSGD